MIKFKKYYVTNGTVKARVYYSATYRTDGRKHVTLYAKDYGHALGKIFPQEYKNDTDIMTDYFDKGQVTLFEDHPLYNAAFERTQNNKLRKEEKSMLDLIKANDKEGLKQMHEDVKKGKVIRLIG